VNQEMEKTKGGRIKELEDKLADLKARWPAHSVPPSMWQELEELEEELERLRQESA
jgi:HAMP domain-containing protein